MKRWIVIAASLLIIVAAIAFILFEFQKKKHNYEKYKTIPDFSFETLYNKIQRTSTLPKYDGYIIFIFNPGCEACQMEATDYFNHIASLQNILFLMLTSDSLPKIKDFAQKQKLDNVDNFIFGHVDANEFETHFGTVDIPSLFIYDSEWKLIDKIRVANSTIIMNHFRNKIAK